MARFGSSDGSGKPSEDQTRSMPAAQRGPRPPGPPPAPFGPANPGRNPGDARYQPGNAPTQYASYNAFDEPTDPTGADFAAPSAIPWFRRRSVLIAWFGLIAVMIALVVWGIIQLTSHGPGGGTTPATSSSSTTSSWTSSTTSSTTSASSSAPSTTAPSAAPPRQAPPQQPPAQQAPPPSEPPHRHLPHLPSVITIPPIPKVPELPTVITLPPRR
ncbi:hypothetical protein [Mycobacterium sp. SMC-15]|uniref:hypothetical protein n=1 Tax=Mycobacterium sp. SMC-15 TaxID=3381627 RepID=UPI0038776F45